MYLLSKMTIFGISVWLDFGCAFFSGLLGLHFSTSDLKVVPVSRLGWSRLAHLCQPSDWVSVPPYVAKFLHAKPGAPGMEKGGKQNTALLLMEEILLTCWYGKYPIMYRFYTSQVVFGISSINRNGELCSPSNSIECQSRIDMHQERTQTASSKTVKGQEEELPSLKLTCSHLKMDDWKTVVSFWEGLFSEANC